MGRLKSYYYIVDRLTAQKAPVLKRALQTISAVEESIIHVEEGVIEVIAAREVEDQIRIACEVAGVALRTRIKKRRM